MGFSLSLPIQHPMGDNMAQRFRELLEIVGHATLAPLERQVALYREAFSTLNRWSRGPGAGKP